MRLTTWNCARGFERKKAPIFAIDSINPDIAVIQECSEKSTKSLPFDGYEAEWVGKNQNIGMGVFYKKNWSVRRLEETANSIEWVVPYEVTGPENFTLIAVWACEVKGNKRESYVGQIRRALDEHTKWFEKSPKVMMGDFNSTKNAPFDKARRGWNHSQMIEALGKHDLISAYHALEKKGDGTDETPTFFQSKNEKKPFHFDYIFTPQRWQSRMSVSIGSYEAWRSMSDHCPVTVDICASA